MAQQVCVVLSAAEREQLAAIAADRNRPRKHIERAQIVLASADRRPAQQVAQSIGVSRPTVWRWQQRFAESGIDGLLRDRTRKPGKAPIAAERSHSLDRPGDGQSHRHLAGSMSLHPSIESATTNRASRPENTAISVDEHQFIFQGGAEWIRRAVILPG
jgi:hypothetical protein